MVKGVSTKSPKIVFQEKYNLVSKALNEEFIFTDDVAHVLTTGYLTGLHVILHGKGGYGKSEMSRIGLHALAASEPKVFTASVGTTVDEIFGGVNVKLLKDPGILAYLAEHSFLNSPYAIIEEALDAPSSALASMKQAISSGYISDNSGNYKIANKLIVMCTNKDPKDFVEDPSIEALMQRFPLQVEVKWPNHDQQTLKRFLIKKREKLFLSNDDIEFLTELLYSISWGVGSMISPRTMLDAAKTYVFGGGVMGLNYIQGLSVPDLERFISLEKETKMKARARRVFNGVYNKYCKLPENEPHSDMPMEELTSIYALCQKTLTDIQDLMNVPCPDDIISQKNNLMNLWETFGKKAITAIQQKITKETKLINIG